MTALFGFAPLEQRLGSSYEDDVLPSGRSLELQRVGIGDPAAIMMRRRQDHSAHHGAGDPTWWLDAPPMLMSSAGKGFEILAYHHTIDQTFSWFVSPHPKQLHGTVPPLWG